MDNALIIDGILAVVLIAGAVIGAKRGLFKSLMGLAVVVIALIGAVLLADLLTDPITDVIAPRIENAVVRQFSEELDKTSQEKTAEAAEGLRGITELLERYGLPKTLFDGALESLSEAVEGAVSAVKEKVTETFRTAVSASVRSLVRNAVHTVLVLVLYILLLVALKLLTGLFDHVFDLPVLNTLNNAGGAIFGFLEAALLLYVAVYAAAHFDPEAVRKCADGGHLLPIFLDHSPIDLISRFPSNA